MLSKYFLNMKTRKSAKNWFYLKHNNNTVFLIICIFQTCIPLHNETSLFRSPNKDCSLEEAVFCDICRDSKEARWCEIIGEEAAWFALYVVPKWTGEQATATDYWPINQYYQCFSVTQACKIASRLCLLTVMLCFVCCCNCILDVIFKNQNLITFLN